MSPKPKKKRILIIRHGALGDFICTLGAFAAIRAHHKNDHITLLTSTPYLSLAQATGFFDEYHIDNRPKVFIFHKWLALRAWFRRSQFDRVYDLQTSKRTNLYYKFFGPGKMPEWSGTATKCSHPQTTPHRTTMHIFDRFADQLKIAGIPHTPLPHVEWANTDIIKFKLPEKFILLIPGCSAQAEFKRWPAAYYAQLAQRIWERGILPVVIGSIVDQTVVQDVLRLCPHVLDLFQKTSLLEVIALAHHAQAIVGNDTGPVHLAAAKRKPTLMLFSGVHNPKKIAPTYGNVIIIEKNPLSALSVDEVDAILQQQLIQFQP
jgi:ADP-heptose:LPS heptosyltransferase